MDLAMIRRIVVIVQVTLAVEVLLIAVITMNSALPAAIRATDFPWTVRLVTGNGGIPPSDTTYALARGRFWLSRLAFAKEKEPGTQLDFLIGHMTTDCTATPVATYPSVEETHVVMPLRWVEMEPLRDIGPGRGVAWDQPGWIRGNILPKPELTETQTAAVQTPPTLFHLPVVEYSTVEGRDPRITHRRAVMDPLAHIGQRRAVAWAQPLWTGGDILAKPEAAQTQTVTLYAHRTLFNLSLWPLVVLLMIYPAIAFVRGPVRRHRRRKRSQCVQCGYNLTGNVTGICPEMG